MTDSLSDDDFYEYLENGGVEKDAIDLMKKEKITATTLPLMDNESLCKYLPLEGDRYLARNYGKSAMPKSLSVLDRLRLKFNQRKRDTTGGVNTAANSKNSTKLTRKIEVGWMDYDFKSYSYKQVRAKSGGGTRNFSINKSSTPPDILTKAKELFFPQNISSRGPLDQYDYSLLDFKLDGLENVTVGSLYEKTNMRILRFYLCTKKKTEYETDSDTLPIFDLDNKEDDLDDSKIAFGPTSGPSDENPTLPLIQDDQDLLQSVLELSHITNEDLPDLDQCTRPMTSTPLSLYENRNIPSTGSQSGSEQADICHVSSGVASEPITADETYPPAELTDNSHTHSVDVIEVTRGNTLPGMIEAFSREDILQKTIHVSVLLPNGKKEKGEGTGVLIDCLTEFWDEFYETCTLGTMEKVPCLRHDFQEKQWQATGRILLYGLQQFKFLPTQISKAYMMATFGYPPTEEELIESFLNFVGDEEGHFLRESLTNFDSVETEELLDVLARFNCKKMPKKDTMRSLLCEISHKQMLQETMFVLDNWKYVIQTSPIDRTELNNMYKNSVPTPRKVIKRLEFPSVISATEQQTREYLKQFIIESDVRTLKLLLRYCTGLNILVKNNEKIRVIFSAMSDFSRRPIGHTCGMVLEIAAEYPSYPVFRSEMRSVLDSGIWTMDIV